jgi:hypothetical protein
MTKAIVSYPKEEQGKVISSRLNQKTGGLGYLSAVDADYKLRMQVAREKIVKKEVSVS